MDNYAPHTFLVSVNNPVPVSGPSTGHLPPDAEMAATIRLPGTGRPDQPPLAQIFTPRSTHRGSHPSPAPFWIHRGPDDAPLCSVQPVAPDVHDVFTAEGVPLARITRRTGRLMPWPRRARWTAHLHTSSQQVTGREGTWYAWLAYVTTAPVWFLLVLCLMVYSYFEGSPDDATFGHPARTRWRVPGIGTALDYRGISKTYHFKPQRLDLRVAYTLAVLRTRDPQR
ncbi:hypothetical protein [Streptomyces sp. NPDC026659]|uniref:hypothetical protein n=1 Tax=Streptomyces sp. NPDC026659 TaxID=3155123 RepID=UPI00340C859B